MSAFKQNVLNAKNKAHKKRLYYTLSIALASFVVIVFLLLSRGTLIEVQPVEAKESAIISASPFSFIVNGHLYSLVSNVVVNAKAKGYKAKTKNLTQADFGKVTTITLEPLPSQLLLTSDHGGENTSWFIDDKLVVVGNILDKTLAAGDYKIGVSHPYFEPLDVNYSLKRGETRKETVKLTPLAGEFEVKSRPQGAVVSINGEIRGQTPMKLPLHGGQFKIVLTKQGYDPIEDEFEVKLGALNPSNDYRLRPKSAGVIVSLSPPGGTLILNGKKIKTTRKVKINPGQKNNLSYKKPGYFTQSELFILGANEVKHYDFMLRKEMGKVEVTSTIPADVYIDGQKVGKTPFDASLNAVEQKVEVRLPGYRTVSQTVTPKADATSFIHAKLVTEKEARLTEAPASYKTKSGDVMVLFKVNDRINMGAERSEPGQRANEFVRTARINKPFYAGRYEVTNAAYAKFKTSHSGVANEPVSNLSWFDAARYANWLSAEEGLQIVYVLNGDQLVAVNADADGYRLLTEAEWEWLARKAGRNKESLFTWGDDMVLPKLAANIADETVKGVVPVFVPHYDDGYAAKASVGSMKKEKSTLFDMGGNVSEWTHDSYNLIPPSKELVLPHALDISLSRSRVVKGGNWRSGSLTELRSSYREGMEQASDMVGFRLARFLYGEN